MDPEEEVNTNGELPTVPDQWGTDKRIEPLVVVVEGTGAWPLSQRR